MSVLQFFVDCVGDAIGTSRYAQLNKHIFKPTLGTELTRNEYNKGLRQSKRLNALPAGSIKEASIAIENGGNERRKETAQAILEQMTDNGVIFCEKRVRGFVSHLQTERGEDPISNVTQEQLSGDTFTRFKNDLRRQHEMKQFVPIS